MNWAERNRWKIHRCKFKSDGSKQWRLKIKVWEARDFHNWKGQMRIFFTHLNANFKTNLVGMKERGEWGANWKAWRRKTNIISLPFFYISNGSTLLFFFLFLLYLPRGTHKGWRSLKQNINDKRFNTLLLPVFLRICELLPILYKFKIQSFYF